MAYVSYTNNTSLKQIRFDGRGDAIRVESGDTVIYETDQTFADVLLLLTKSEIVGPATYVGYARPGTGVNELGWAVCKIQEVGGVESKLWAGGRVSFRWKWVDRATLSYS